MLDGIMALKGLRESTLELLLVDTLATLTYGDALTVEAPQLVGISEESVDVKLPAADSTADTDSTTTGVVVTLKFGKMHLRNLAALLGATLDDQAGYLKLIRKKTDIRPYVRINALCAYLGQGITGVFELHVAKCKVQGNVAFQLNGENPEYATVTLTFGGIERVNDKEFYHCIQRNTVVSLPVGTPDTTPPALSSSVPADAATAVAVSADLVITLTEAIQFDAQQWKLYKVNSATDIVEVASAVTIDATNTIVTINPTSNMTAAKEHVGIGQGFRDLAGNQATTPIVINFTTA